MELKPPDLILVPFASFENNCVKTWTFFTTPFNPRGNHFLVHGTEKGVTSVFMHVASFKLCCHSICKRQRFNMTFLELRLLSKIYFR